ncbi:MAG: FAD-dependent oxidoreductase [Actinomycetes bacterium]
MIAIIGAGPAGLAAAVTVAKKGEKVILIDSSTRLGGQYWRHLPSNWNQKRLPYFAEAQELFDQVLSSPLITWYSNAHVWQAEKKNKIFYLYVLKNGVEEVITAKKVILATGAYDRTLPFPGWTSPGVMTPGAAQAMLKTHGVLVGKKIVIAGTGPFLLPVATGLASAGAEIVALLEANKPWRWILNVHGLLLNPSKIREGIYYLKKLRSLGISIQYGSTVTSFEAGIAKIGEKKISCDVVAVGWGFVPELSLAGILGAKLKVEKDGTVVIDVNQNQETSIQGLFAAGESTGIGGSVLAIAEGEIAAGKGNRLTRWRAQVFAKGLQRVYPVSSRWLSSLNSEVTLCRCEEVRVSDIHSAIVELGAQDGRSAKLLTRAGMGLCQGRVCGRNVSEVVASQLSREVPDQERIASASRPLAGPISLGELGDGLGKKF